MLVTIIPIVQRSTRSSVLLLYLVVSYNYHRHPDDAPLLPPLHEMSLWCGSYLIWLFIAKQRRKTKIVRASTIIQVGVSIVSVHPCGYTLTYIHQVFIPRGTLPDNSFLSGTSPGALNRRTTKISGIAIRGYHSFSSFCF